MRAARYTSRRWLLLNREQPLPAVDGGAGQWSIDHLFVEQDGIPTLVEVKRQTDTRLRREVVGQMLDYAANAVMYQCVERLRASFHSKFPNPEEKIRDRLGPEIDPEAFRQNVKTNLQAGRIRLLFVADQIPSELERIVEFLNTQMNPAEVLALKLQRFEGQGLKTIVPVLYGQSAEARVIKGSRKNARFPPLAVVQLTNQGKTDPKKPETRIGPGIGDDGHDPHERRCGHGAAVVESDRSMPMMAEVDLQRAAGVRDRHSAGEGVSWWRSLRSRYRQCNVHQWSWESRFWHDCPC